VRPALECLGALLKLKDVTQELNKVLVIQDQQAMFVLLLAG
jgi:hypothetical protein